MTTVTEGVTPTLEAPTPRPASWRTPLLVLAVSLGFGMLEAIQGKVLYPDLEWSKFLPEAMVRTLPCWIVLAALLPAIVHVARRARVDRSSWPVALPAQALAGVVFVLVHIGLSAVTIALLRRSPDHSVERAFLSIFSKYAVMDFFTYAGIVAALHAVHYQAEERRRAVAASELQAGLVQAQLASLRRRLDPHFLFNALHSISALALQGRREEVVHTVSALGEALRMSLDDSEAQEVALASELAFLERYLEVERVRFGERLTVERRIDPGALTARVPSLVLQPLVENAVRHGIEPRRQSGRVVVEAACERDTLRLEVRDTGPGFPPPPWREGIGLTHTRARLQHLHGAAQRLDIGRAPEGGARVTVVIPLSTLPAAAAAS